MMFFGINQEKIKKKKILSYQFHTNVKQENETGA
jgi:hypothetical protein